MFAHNFIFSEPFHMYNLIWTSQKSGEAYVVNLWNQISHKGQVFLDRNPPDCKLHRKDNTKALPKRKGLHHLTKIPPHLPCPLLLSAHLRLLGSLADSVRADKAPAPNPISRASQCYRLSQSPDGGLSSRQRGAADVPYNTSGRKETAFWGILGFFFVVGWRPVFFLPGRELPVFP